MKTHFKLLLGVYGLMAIVTFGHAWNREYPGMMDGTQMIAAPTCAVLWPLYWSEVFWQQHGAVPVAGGKK